MPLLRWSGPAPCLMRLEEKELSSTDRAVLTVQECFCLLSWCFLLCVFLVVSLFSLVYVFFWAPDPFVHFSQASRLLRFWFWYPLQRNIICSFNCLQTCSWMCCPLYTVCCWSQGRASCSETFQTMFKAKVTVPLIWSLRCQTKPRMCSSLIFNLILFYVQFSVWCCDSTLLVLHTKSSYFH